MQKWLDEVNTNRSFLNYRLFKQNLIFEPYLIKLPFYYRLSFSKFRCKQNKLPINKHRFDKNDVDTTCQLCNLGDIGDEFHYLLICNYFNRERKLYIDDYYYRPPNTIKMFELFNLTHVATLINLCKFLKLIMEKFQ